MKGFWNNIKSMFVGFFRGRNGIDNLGMFTFLSGLILQTLDMFVGTGILSVLGMGLYVWSLFRMFSRNTTKRAEENRRYTEWTENAKIKTRQFFVRLKNCRKYKYFKCPQCKAYLRLKRGAGEGTVRCSRCGHSFRKKA